VIGNSGEKQAQIFSLSRYRAFDFQWNRGGQLVKRRSVPLAAQQGSLQIPLSPLGMNVKKSPSSNVRPSKKAWIGRACKRANWRVSNGWFGRSRETGGCDVKKMIKTVPRNNLCSIFERQRLIYDASLSVFDA
jgi:hypothetical protein